MEFNTKSVAIDLLLVIVISSIFIQNVGTCPQESRSTESLRDVFIGRCLNFQMVHEGSFCSDIKNCSYLWELFFEAFAHQAPCNVSEERYRPFVDAAFHATPRNKHIFWSGVVDFMSRYSYDGRKWTAIDDRLSGYLGAGLNWCGSLNATDGNEVNVTSCPPYERTPDCPMSANAAYWAEVSIQFAKGARGFTKIMLNSSFSPSFRQESFLTTKELPYLKSPVITQAHIVMVHTVGTVPKENCSSKSVLNLTTILNSRGIVTDCEEQPRDVVLLQCADFPDYEGCDVIRTSGSSMDVMPPVITVILFFIAILCFDN